MDRNMAEKQKFDSSKVASATQKGSSTESVSEHENTASEKFRPWGSASVLENGSRYKIKRVVVKPGHRLSLQVHQHRSEHWVVLSGTAKVTCGASEALLSTNQSTYIPACTTHRLENPGTIPLVLIEVQSGEYLGEDDIVRLQSDYGQEHAPKPSW